MTWKYKDNHFGFCYIVSFTLLFVYVSRSRQGSDVAANGEIERMRLQSMYYITSSAVSPWAVCISDWEEQAKTERGIKDWVKKNISR